MITAHLKILILDDDQNDIDLIHRELKRNKLNFTSHISQDREAFEHALDNFEPDIILSDYSLPAFDGFSAFKITQEKLPHIPFIIISGTLGDERAVEMIKNGITDYALKDQLYALTPKITRALMEAQKHKEKNAVVEKLKMQNKKLREIAVMQSHQVRVPVVQILGLFNLFKFDKPEDPVNAEVLGMLKVVAESLDKTILEIVQKTNDIDNGSITELGAEV